MKPIVIFASLFCIFLIGAALFLGTHDSGGSRLINMDPQYTQRTVDGYWKRGSDTPKVTLDVYSDFQCEACVVEYPIIEAAMQTAGPSVQLRFHEFPLNTSPTSILAAEAAESAGRQGKFWLMYQRLYSTHTAWMNQSQDQLLATFLGYAKEFGMNPDQFKRDFNDSSLTDQIDVDVKNGNNLHVQSIPTFFINGKLSPLPQSSTELMSQLNSMTY